MMSAQTVSQTSNILRQMIVRYRWIGALGLLTVVVALAGYSFTSMPATPSPIVDRAQTSLDSAQQGVLSYLRVHASVRPLATPAMSLDPAQQSVLSYLRAHENVERSRAPWDPAVQAVLDYLRAHSR